MWNWLVSGLSTGATLVLYDGYPFLEHGNYLFRIAEEEQVTVFGTNAKWISAIEKEGLHPAATHNLSSLKTVLSTGSPLLPESFDYIYSKVKTDLCLSSIAGGTDIIGCFALGCPALPVYRGKLQMRSLGLNVQVYNDAGHSVTGEKEELVCVAPFPSMPKGFWGDDTGERYSQENCRKRYAPRFEKMYLPFMFPKRLFP